MPASRDIAHELVIVLKSLENVGMKSYDLSLVGSAAESLGLDCRDLRATSLPIRYLFVGMRDFKKQHFLPWCCAELKANWHAHVREPALERECGERE